MFPKLRKLTWARVKHPAPFHKFGINDIRWCKCNIFSERPIEFMNFTFKYIRNINNFWRPSMLFPNFHQSNTFALIQKAK